MQNTERAFVYPISSAATTLLENFSESLDGTTSELVIDFLQENNLYENVDYLLVEAEGDVKFLGLRGNTIDVNVKGQRYSHLPHKGIDPKEISRKFEKMLQFSSWKALRWLNKNTSIISGSKAKQQQDLEKHLKESHEEMQNYMFFGNLKTIQKCIEKMMAMNPAEVDALLNEHDWASDHIATSKDDVEEVCNWLCNTLGHTN